MSRLNLGTYGVLIAVAFSLLPPVLLAQQSSAMQDELITTARKREESLQDAPVAVSVFSGESLEFRGVTDIDKLDQFTPNLVLNNSPTFSNVSNAAVYIRGIGQNDFVPVIDPGVGIYVDGVYLGRSVGAVLDLVDIEQVEVLRGPQGTLFGRNTIGGAVVLTTAKPNDEQGGKISVKYGTDDRINLQATLNMLLTDNLYSRFTFASFQQDGYVTREFDGLDLGNDDTIAVRGALRWMPSDNVTVDWSFDYSRDRENGAPAVLTGVQPVNFDLATNPMGGPSMATAANTIAAQIATDPAALATGGGEFFDTTPGMFPFNSLACFQPNNTNNPVCINEQWFDDGGKSVNYGTDETFANLNVRGTGLTIQWDINDDLTLKSVTSYREFDGEFSGDEDATPVRGSLLIDPYEQEQWTQELQLLGNSFDDRLEWIIGAFYFEEEGFNINPVRFSQVDIQSGGFFEADSWAVFAQGTYAITEKLDLTLGIRYTEDTRDYLPDQFFEAFPIGPLPFTCPPGVPMAPTCGLGDRVLPFEWVTTEAEETTPSVNISYRWNDNLLTYLTYSEGYKSGGFTQRIFPPEASTPSFEPEFVDSYEVGAKYNNDDDSLRLNAAIFYTDYTDLQLLVADPTRIGPFVTNAGDAEFSGVELELYLNPSDGLFITSSLGYLDQDRETLSGSVLGLTLDSRFEQTSEWMANAQIYREFQVGQLGYLTPRFEWAFRSEYGTNQNGLPRDGADVVDPADIVCPPGACLDANGTLGWGVANPALLEDDLHILNASIQWMPSDSDLRVSLGVDNLTDENFTNFGNYQDGFGWTTEIFDRGRQWYVQVNYEF